MSAIELESLIEIMSELDRRRAVLYDLKQKIKAELAKPEPEPVAEIIRHFNNGNFSHVSVKFLTNPDLIIHGAKLYTHPPAHQKPEPDYWHVVDEDGNSIYSASFKQACHDHINDALNNSNAFIDIDAEKWIVEGLFVKPPAQQKPLSDDEIRQIAVEDQFLLYCDIEEFKEIARAIEKAHGIK